MHCWLTLARLTSSLRVGSIIGLTLWALTALACRYAPNVASSLARAVDKIACILSVCRSYLVEWSEMCAVRS